MASLELPVFDISKPFDSASLLALSQACKEWGFFRITNHGVSRDLHAKLRVLSNALFGLSDETKLKVGPFTSEETYTPHFVASPFFESLRVSGPDFYASALSSAEILLQDHNNADQFSEILKEYGNIMTELSKRIVEVLLMSLGSDFEKKFNDSEFGKCNGYFRIINYTAPKRITPTEINEHGEEEEVEGLGMHTDMSCVTIVNQDQIGGLQVRSKQGNNWMDIKPCEQTLVVNVGDLLQAWSNGKLSSSEHRVVLRQPVGRFSTAFFWCFEDEKMVFAPEEVVGDGNYSRAYRPFVCKDYLEYRSAMASVEGSEKNFENVGFTVKDFAGNSI